MLVLSWVKSVKVEVKESKKVKRNLVVQKLKSFVCRRGAASKKFFPRSLFNFSI